LTLVKSQQIAYLRTGKEIRFRFGSSEDCNASVGIGHFLKLI